MPFSHLTAQIASKNGDWKELHNWSKVEAGEQPGGDRQLAQVGRSARRVGREADVQLSQEGRSGEGGGGGRWR